MISSMIYYNIVIWVVELFKVWPKIIMVTHNQNM
jgi:hypothetical protein